MKDPSTRVNFFSFDFSPLLFFSSSPFLVVFLTPAGYEDQAYCVPWECPVRVQSFSSIKCLFPFFPAAGRVRL